ncbi:MAG: DISARM system phospholipase D-like protein DrmC [Gemmatimonadota bacterium]|nr:DISARM system phospholipase D-like protein DrmC [Gemmatimonadota bacterium]
MGTENLSVRLGGVALALSDSLALEDTCRALDEGRLTRFSAAASWASISGGNSETENALRALSQAWNLIGDDLQPRQLALLLRSSISAVASYQRSVPKSQVVWTGPSVAGSFLRSTREVIREIIRGAQESVLVVGYWIAIGESEDNVIADLISSLAEASERGARITLIVDERGRADGRDNIKIFSKAWPEGVPPPTLLTWRLPAGDRHLKLHAKVLVGDRRDALVTSANLTSHGMMRNMEMGVRIVGQPAADIAQHFSLLERYEVVVRYPPQASDKT